MLPTDASPLVTVVIPVYNGARFLKRSVGSVLAQTQSNLEIIVVDDGSKDNPQAAVEELGAPSVRVITHEQNRGLPAARNTGIRASRGQFLAFLDADDWWESEKLTDQLNLLGEAPQVDVVFSDYIHVLPNGELGKWRGGLLQDLSAKGLRGQPTGSHGFVFEGTITHDLIKYTSFIHPSSVVARRGVFDKVGLFDEAYRYVEDLQMWIRLANRCRIGMIDKPLIRVESNPVGLSHQTWKMSTYLLRLYSSLKEIVPDLPPDLAKHVRNVCVREHTALGWYMRTQGDGVAARRHYWSALTYKFDLMTLARWLRAWWPAKKPPVA